MSSPPSPFCLPVADHCLAWGHLRNLLETCPAEDALPAQESSPLGSLGAQLAPTPGVHCSKCLAVVTSRFSLRFAHRPSTANLYAKLRRAARLASAPSTRGPTPSRLQPAFGLEARVGRFPARNLPLSSPLYSNSRAGLCGAQPLVERTEDPELGHPSALIGVADPGDTLGLWRERGRQTWARVEVGVACCRGWAHRPPALRMLFSFQFSQPPPCTGRKTLLPLAPLRREEGKGEGLALGQRAGMADCTCT
ncbi:uncharacterized protein LOC119004052 [Sturnira hondurensis]|uniref:uncharacterized protein LOC119004052 n=1 Tax=Sturnira hondurensis TaxID=192404 RepID=UPI0018798CCA|nr:uncharacterized protein LOC119004052 [Sturnira hondurensis]